MKLGDPFVLSAMDGQEDGNGQAPRASDLAKREEPTALFYAIFGLAYEALAASSADSNPSVKLRQNATIALEALKSLLLPEYSGNALLDPTIFDEFMSLCYRMAMTESAVVQVHLVEAIAIFATNQKFRLPTTQT